MTRAIAQILRTEREKRQLDRQQLADETFVPIEDIVALEEHGIVSSRARLRRLAEKLELDPEALRRGEREDSRDPVVFFRHRSARNFSAVDCGLLADQLQIGRALVEVRRILDHDPGLRAKFVPDLPNTIPRQQGIEAAQRVRRELQIPTAPLHDLQSVLEDDFSTAVTICRLNSTTVEAATVKDPLHGSAVVVINDNAGPIRANPPIFRRVLAHELAHVLLDLNEADPDFILDTQDSRLSELGHPPLETRANAFAAELLIPTAGLKKLLGPPQLPVPGERARRFVEEVEQHFIAPRDLTILHLFNRKYIDKHTCDLLQDSGPPLPPTAELPWLTPVRGIPRRLVDRLREAHDRYLITGGGVRELLGLSPDDTLPWES